MKVSKIYKLQIISYSLTDSLFQLLTPTPNSFNPSHTPNLVKFTT